MLQTPIAAKLHPAYLPLLDLVDTRYITAAFVANRWRWSEQHLANLRRGGKGPAYTNLGRSVRYTLPEILAWEIAGRSPHITADRLTLATAALKGYTHDQRADIANQLQALITGKVS